VTGKTIYSTKGREQSLSLLPDASRGAAMTRCAQYDAAPEVRRRAEKELVTEEAHGRPVSRVLESCPGLGPIRVSQLVPIVVSPNRFRTKRRSGRTAGSGIVIRSSSDWIRAKDGAWARAEVQKTRGDSRNHVLKHIFKGAATTVITQLETEPLHHDYKKGIAAGTKPNLALT